MNTKSNNEQDPLHIVRYVGFLCVFYHYFVFHFE